MLTMLETRGKIHFAEGGVNPFCRSRAEVIGFHHRADGAFSLPAGARWRLCPSCIEGLRIMVDDASESPPAS